MNKHTTLPSLLQKIVSDEEIQTITEAVGHRDPSRKFTVRTLIDFFLLAAVKEWKSFRHGADVAPSYGLPCFHYSTVASEAKSVPYEVMKRLFALIVSKCNRKTRRVLRFPKPLCIVDSTTVTVGINGLLWAPYHGDRSGVKLHVAYLPEWESPMDTVETIARRHDEPVGETLADRRFILVEDRAYFKIERIDQFAEEGHFFVIRMKDNVEIYRRKSL